MTVTPAVRDKKIFCFGYGYTAQVLCHVLRQYGWAVAGTTRDSEKRRIMEADGIEVYLFDPATPLADPQRALAGVTHILLSVPPDANGDPVYELHARDLAICPDLEWVGYLSTTGVYGNRDGAWVSEEVRPAPTSRRGDLRYNAERQWQSLHEYDGLPLHIFRLSGIYGPGRSAIDSVRAGKARRIEKPGHVFNRIHVDDIVQILMASMNKPNPGAIYNVADDHPSPSHEVIAYAATLLGIDPPPCVPFDQADMAPIVRSFYADNKKIKNDKIKEELGVALLHPDYKSGLEACFEIEAKAMSFLNFSCDEGEGEKA